MRLDTCCAVSFVRLNTLWAVSLVLRATVWISLDWISVWKDLDRNLPDWDVSFRPLCVIVLLLVLLLMLVLTLPFPLFFLGCAGHYYIVTVCASRSVTRFTSTPLAGVGCGAR